MQYKENCNSIKSSPNIVEHQALTVGKGDAHIPVEPADLVAIHLKAGALWLHNVDGLLACMSKQSQSDPTTRAV